MHRLYDRYLQEKYQPLYRLRHNPKYGFDGFSVGDGWFNIINTLSYSLCSDWFRAKTLLKYKTKEIGTTTEELANWHEKVEIEAKAIHPVVQVKEKFGSLRFYTLNTTDRENTLIEIAENISAVTCECCGNPGRIVMRKHWLKCLCKSCIAKYRSEGVEINVVRAR